MFLGVFGLKLGFLNYIKVILKLNLKTLQRFKVSFRMKITPLRTTACYCGGVLIKKKRQQIERLDLCKENRIYIRVKFTRKT